MAHVNLLPWRAERRKQREREFFMQLATAFVVAVLAVLLWAFWMGQRIDNQNERNSYLQAQIKQLDVRIAKIKDLENVRERLLARKQIIEQLQADRSQMVHLFDELVKTIPDSARLTGLNQAGQSMTLSGVAQSNASVAEYMRNIQASPWMGHTDLSKTENSHDSSRMPYTFGLKVSLSHPKTDEAAGDDDVSLVPAAAGSTTVVPTTGKAVKPSATSARPGRPASAAGKPATPPPHAAAKGGAKS